MDMSIRQILYGGLLFACFTGSAEGQSSLSGSSGDFRARTSPETTVMPSSPPIPAAPAPPAPRQDLIGGPSAADVLKRLDKELGSRSVLERSGGGDPSRDFERELRSPADRFK